MRIFLMLVHEILQKCSLYHFLQAGVRNVFDEAIQTALNPPTQPKAKTCRLL